MLKILLVRHGQCDMVSMGAYRAAGCAGLPSPSSRPPTRRPEAGSTTCTPTPQNLTVDQRIGGRTNHSPLTPLGERQAQALGAHLRAALAHAGVQPQRCAFFSSTAVRAVDTARLVMKELDVSGWGADNAAVSAGGHGTRPAVCAMLHWPPMVPSSTSPAHQTCATCLPLTSPL